MTTTYISLHNIKSLTVSDEKTTEGELGTITWRTITLIDKSENRMEIAIHVTPDFTRIME